MRLNPPEAVSQQKIELDVAEIEPLLQAPPMDIKPFPPAMITLKDGRTMVIREARMEEAPLMLEYMRKVMDIDHDFYDIVGARVYAEILGWYRKRLKDPYTLVGMIDGEWVGFANGRLLNEKVNISLHTMALARGGRIGAVMYYTKAAYAFEVLGQEEWWATYESYNGWHRWGLGMAQPSYPWPEYQHELGGARVYYITRNYSGPVLMTAGAIAFIMGFIGPLADVVSSMPTAVSGGLSIYLFGVIGMQGIALMMAEKVNLFDPKQLAIGATILIVGIGGNIGYPGGFLPFPYLKGVFPNGLPAIATGAVLGILLNLIFVVFKPAVERQNVLNQ